MIKNNKYLAIVIGSIGLVSILFGTTYSWFTYQREGSSQELIAGDIYLNLNEGDGEIELSNIFPETFEEARNRNDNYITFDVTGLNTSTKDIYYEIILDHGTDKASPKSRYNDSDLRFDLVELDSNGEEIEYLLSGVSYDSLFNQRIYVDTINANTSNDVEKHYKLRMWLSEDVIISDTETNANYTTAEYPNKYATIKLIVAGDFSEKSAPVPARKLIQSLASTKNYVASYDDLIASNQSYSTFTSQDTVGINNNKQTVYYYTGADAKANANVLFAGFCWQIVRTTDNGGVRLLYNGVAVNNKCENTREVTKGVKRKTGGSGFMGTYIYGKSYDYDLETGMFTIEDTDGLPSTWNSGDTNNNGIIDYEELIGTYSCFTSETTCSEINYIGGLNWSDSTYAEYIVYEIGDISNYSEMGKSPFNVHYDSIAHAGYMFNNEYSIYVSVKSEEYYRDAVWNDATGVYILSNGNGGTAPDATHHYICHTNCSKVRYYISESYYFLLDNGKTIKDVLKETLNYKLDPNDTTDENINVHDSAIKGYLDNWYKKNLTSYSSYLDNETVYCNDRSVSELRGWDPNGTYLSQDIQFSPSSKNLDCTNKMDRFSVTNYGVAELKYSIGLLTSAEAELMNSSHENSFWSGTPSDYHYIKYISSNGSSSGMSINYNMGVRGVITLKSNILFESGSGTYLDPYIVGPIVDRNS